jgi:hypothetical protein
VGAIPPEVWNRLGTKILPKLRLGADLRLGVDFSISVKTDSAPALVADLRQALQDLGLTTSVEVRSE